MADPAGYFLYASFPNSRNKSRSPTVNAITYQVTTGDLADPLTLVAGPNQNRTYIILSNFSDSYNLLYVYAEPTTVDPSATSTFGVAKQLLYRTTTNQLYQKQATGDGTDWVAVAIDDVGERVLPFQNASLESLGTIYATSEDPTNAIQIGIDEGRG